MAQMVAELVQGRRIIGPVDQPLALFLIQSKPMVELQFHARQIQLAPHTERNAAPVANEVVLKGKAMAGLIDVTPRHWYQPRRTTHL